MSAAPVANTSFGVLPPEANHTHNLGVEILQNRFYNKSTAFTLEERARLGITARLPATVETLDEQLVRYKRQLDHFTDPINKYSFLRHVQDTNNTAFYALVSRYLPETLPVIYTPTVGAACLNFSNLYSQEHGVYIKQTDLGKVNSILDAVNRRELDVIVITDGSRILGLGDLGVNGMGIPIGKCSLYVAGAGLDPRRVLPVCLDVGTNNKEMRENPLYVGLNQERCDDETFYALLDEFMAAITKRFPGVMVQFEDFSNNHCFDILERYRHKYNCFNDDIQGTGAVIAAGVANALRLAKTKPADQRIVLYGAGSAAVGVVEAIGSLFRVKHGVSAEDFAKTVYLVDTKGLVTNTRGDTLAKHKVAFARTDVAAADNEKFKNLDGVVKQITPTILIGLAGSGPAFTEEMVRHMAAAHERPIILPLSNPTSKAEITAEDAFKWTDGKAIVASGSPFAPVTLNGKTHTTSQGNNMYIFPGIGLGATVARTKSLSDDVMTSAAVALADMVPEADLEKGLYPPLSDIKAVSAVVAAAAAQCAAKEGNTRGAVSEVTAEAVKTAREAMWEPVYATAAEYDALLQASAVYE